jgi:ABC-type molybdate transport system ATPase subunit
VALNIRPEAIAVVRRDDTISSSNRLAGKVLASVYQGSLVEYEIECAGRSIKANVINPKGKPLFHRGDEVAIVFAPEDVLVIKTGQAR